MPRRLPAVEAMAPPRRVGRLRAGARLAQPGPHALISLFIICRRPTPAAGRRPPSAGCRASYPQIRRTAVHGLWMTCPSEPVRRLGAVVPKRHARRAVTRSLLKRQICAAGGRHAAALRPRPVDGAPARAVRSRPVRQRGVAGLARASPAPSSTTCSARPAAAARHEPRACARACGLLPRRLLIARGARLSAAAQPLARQRLPLRADLLGLRASTPCSATARWPAAP